MTLNIKRLLIMEHISRLMFYQYLSWILLATNCDALYMTLDMKSNVWRLRKLLFVVSYPILLDRSCYIFESYTAPRIKPVVKGTYFHITLSYPRSMSIVLEVWCAAGHQRLLRCRVHYFRISRIRQRDTDSSLQLTILFITLKTSVVPTSAHVWYHKYAIAGFMKVFLIGYIAIKHAFWSLIQIMPYLPTLIN